MFPEKSYSFRDVHSFLGGTSFEAMATFSQTRWFLIKALQDRLVDARDPNRDDGR